MLCMLGDSAIAVRGMPERVRHNRYGVVTHMTKTPSDAVLLSYRSLITNSRDAYARRSTSKV
jgi:hypothetical protein